MEYRKFEETNTCGICFELINEDDMCSRVLICGHTFCNFCLRKILLHSSNCPSCKTEISSEKREQISLGHFKKSMISSDAFNILTDLRKSSLEQLPPTSSKGKLDSIGYCSEHTSFRELRCMDCETWICAMCSFLHHKNCRKLLVKETCKELKEQASQKLENELEARKSIRERIADSLRDCYQERNTLIEEIKQKEKMLKVNEKRIEELENLQSDEYKLCKKLKYLNYFFETDDYYEFVDAVNKLEEGLKEGKRQMLKLDTLEILIPKSIETLGNLCGRQSVYVVEVKSSPRYGKVKVSGDQIWISSFQTEKPKARLLPFQEFLTIFLGSSKLLRKAYLKLSPEGGGEDVDIVIETDGVSPRAKNFLLLCSTAEGERYKGLAVSFNHALFSYVINEAPHATMEGIRLSDSTSPWSEGNVFGMMGGNFVIYISLKDIKNCTFPKIGIVVSGLEKLKELNGRNLKVKDSGMIIS